MKRVIYLCLEDLLENLECMNLKVCNQVPIYGRADFGCLFGQEFIGKKARPSAKGGT